MNRRAVVALLMFAIPVGCFTPEEAVATSDTDDPSTTTADPTLDATSLNDDDGSTSSSSGIPDGSTTDVSTTSADSTGETRGVTGGCVVAIFDQSNFGEACFE